MSPSPASPARPSPAARTRLTWFGHATFSIVTPGGTVLVIDPWFGNPSAKDPDALGKLGCVDFLLLTHGHSDHSADAIAVGKAGATLVGSYELAAALEGAGYPAEKATAAFKVGNAGGTIPLNDEVKVTLVPAIHSSGIEVTGRPGPAPYGGAPLGFVIQIADGPTIYDTGDTDAFYDMETRVGARFGIDLMLACIGGHFTMDPDGAALAASWVRPKAIVPMHFGTFPILAGTPSKLAEALAARGVRSEVIELPIGEPREF